MSEASDTPSPSFNVLAPVEAVRDSAGHLWVQVKGEGWVRVTGDVLVVLLGMFKPASFELVSAVSGPVRKV